MGKPLRVFIGQMEIAGIADGLFRAFRNRGDQVSLVLAQPHPFEYAFSSENVLAGIWLRLGSLKQATRKFLPLAAFFWMVWKFWSCLVLFWALFKFDTYIFIFGRSITDSSFEDCLHKVLGHRVMFVYCGSDIRPPYIDGPACLARGTTARKLASSARRMRKRLHRRERLGFISVNSPLTGQFHSKPYVNWFAIGVPRDLAAPATAMESAARDTVRILHSPSHPEIKGSALIREAVERLQAKGHAIDFIELRGVPNSKVAEELRACDFVVDQLYSDTPMAGFAMEAALAGKPAVVGSYAASLFARYREAWSLPPSLCVHPDELEAAIETLVSDAAHRLALGAKARAFVESIWSLDAVAGRYARVLAGDIPAGWLAQPGFEYVQGCGLGEARARTSVQRVIAIGGVDALQLTHSPALGEAFKRFAAS